MNQTHCYPKNILYEST